MRSLRRWSVVLVVSCLLISAAAFAQEPVEGVAQGFYIAPHVNNVAPDGVTFCWETHQPEIGSVAYGRDGDLSATVPEEAAVKIHRVRITGLEADTVYRYRIASGADVQERSFKTAPGTRRPVTFVVLGDSRRWGTNWAESKMAEHAKQWDAEFYLNVGDLVGSGHVYEQWPEHFTRFADITDHLWMLTARGNHEGSMKYDVEKDWFGKYHDLPGGEPYAAFDWGNTHFVIVSFEQTPGLTKFLDKHMPSVDNKYTVVAQHFPIYCTGYASADDSRKELGQGPTRFIAAALDRHNVTMNIAGHTHIYERLHRIRGGKRDDAKGTQYLVNGGDIGGNYPDWFTALGDDRRTMEQPTYTVVHMGDDRIWFRTFCWGLAEKAVIEIDYKLLWQDEAIPKAELAKLDGASGGALVAAIDELAAMGYAPAADKLLALLDSSEAAVPRSAAKALREIGSAGISAALVQHLADADLAVRRTLARALEIAMDPGAANAVADAALDTAQDEQTRVNLIGALQFHAPPALATKTMVALIEAADTPAPVRERAAYALSRTARVEDVETLAAMFKKEPAGYVMTRVAMALNEICGRRQSLSDRGPLGRSKPGEERQKFIDKWMRQLEKKETP